jgi:hypothetical protein
MSTLHLNVKVITMYCYSVVEKLGVVGKGWKIVTDRPGIVDSLSCKIQVSPSDDGGARTSVYIYMVEDWTTSFANDQCR